MKMHADEVDIDEALVGRLIAAQLPQLSGLPLRPVAPRGTDNALYRIGDDLVARLPRHEVSVPALRKELRWAPELAPQLPVDVPVPVAVGVPGMGFPFEWAVFRWVAGEPATPDRLRDEHQTMLDLAALIGAFQRIDPRDGPGPDGRGGPLGPRDGPFRAALGRLPGQSETDVVLSIWADSLSAPAWTDESVWMHGDLDARNVLARGGRIAAVVDLGSVAVGDPACDVMVAWKMLSAAQRPAFRAALGVDDATWRRARGWALSQAVIALGYYTPENAPTLVGEAWNWLRAVVDDPG